jgi:hypothetical protein
LKIRGHAARPGRAQDEQELRQHDPAVCAARADAQAHHGHPDRFARARRAQGHRGLGPVPALPGIRQPEETAALRQAYADGIAWGDAKQMLFERIDREVAPMREQYEALMVNNPAQVEAILLAGAQKARELSRAPLHGRTAPGRGLLRNLGAAAQPPRPSRQDSPACLQAIPRKRRQVLLQAGSARRRSAAAKPGFDSPREPGQLIARLKARKPLPLPSHALVAGRRSWRP